MSGLMRHAFKYSESRPCTAVFEGRLPPPPGSDDVSDSGGEVGLWHAFFFKGGGDFVRKERQTVLHFCDSEAIDHFLI